MLNLSQDIVDNLSPEGRLEVAAHALGAADATIHDLAEQLTGAKVLLRATKAALRVSQAHVDQLLGQVKEQATTIRRLHDTLGVKDQIVAGKLRTIEIQAHQLDKLQMETTQAQCAARGRFQMINMLVLDAMWEPMLGDHAAEIDYYIRQGDECLATAIRQLRATTGYNLVLCRTLVEKRAKYL